MIFLCLVLTSCGGEIVEGKYELDYSPNEEINLVVPTGNGYQLIVIPGHILFYGHNKDFILATQKPADSIYNVEEDLRFPQMMAKIFKTRFSVFWIITLKDEQVYGPLSKSGYLMMRETLSVPESLQLNNSTKRFYKKGQREDVEYDAPDTTVIHLMKSESI